MSWPNISADGTLLPFTADQINALELEPCDIRNGDHPTFELDSQGCSIRRMFFCKWSQRDNAIAYLLGASSIVNNIPNTLSRQMPQAFPDAGYSQYVAIAIEQAMGARSAGINNLVDPIGVPSYKSAKLIVRYEQVFFGLGTDAQYGGVTSSEYNRYTERIPSSTDTSYLSIPGSMMMYRTSSGNPPNGYSIPYNTGKPEVQKRISFKWRRLPYAAWDNGGPLYRRVFGSNDATIYVPPGVPAPPAGFGKVVGAPYIGTVNSDEFLGYQAGQLLFEGVDEEIVPDQVSGQHCWNLTFKWLVKAVLGGPPNAPEAFAGHNYLYYGGRPPDGTAIPAAGSVPGYYLATKSNAWVYPGHIYDGACLFNERNHANLFKVGSVPDSEI